MKKSFCLLIALIFHVFISGQETGCISGDCDNGYGTYIWSTGDKYVGDWYNKKMQGSGTYYFSNGHKYKGTWRNGAFDGYGTYFDKDGKEQVGYWANNEFLGKNNPNLDKKGCISGDCDNGHGVYVFKSGEKYEGNWKNLKRNGFGINYWPNGSWYKGEWKDDKKNGEGTNEYSNGDKYTGKWKNGKREGEGTFFYANGTIEKGYWVEGEYVGKKNTKKLGCISGNCINGLGTFIYATGGKYIGNFRNGKRDGYGAYKWVEGDRYQGYWKEGLLSGNGLYHYSNGDKYDGEWKNHKRHGSGTETLVDGTIKIGMWEEGKYVGTGTNQVGCISGDCDDGYGVYAWKSGEKYVGNWKNNKRNGQGVNTWADGWIHDGEWKDDKRHGYGTKTSPSGVIKKGFWDYGKYSGENITKSGCISGNCLTGNGTYVQKNGDIYTGAFKNGFYEGQGTYTFAEGHKYVGEFKNGKYHGQGNFKNAKDRSKYVGGFAYGRYHGHGIITYVNGTSKSGMWRKGEFISSKENEKDSISKNNSKSISRNNKENIPTEKVILNKQQDSINGKLEIRIIYPISKRKGINEIQTYPIISSNYTEFIVDIKGGSGNNNVLINGQKTTRYTDGHYYKNVPLKTGENIVEVFANDDKGNKLKITTKIICTYESNIDVKDGKYYGVIIGVNEYTDESLTDLDRPVLDAKKLKDLLIEKYTFEKENILLLENPKRTDLINSFEDILGKIKKQDNLLIFYAGHGLWDDEREIGYWLPSNSNALDSENWFRNSTLKDFIKSTNCKHTLLITDACFGGSIFKTRAANGSDIHAYSKLYKLQSRKGMTSGALHKVPDNSIFVDYLIKRLEQNTEKYLPASKLFNSMRDAVLNNSPNVPQYGIIQGVGDEGGEFIFIKK